MGVFMMSWRERLCGTIVLKGLGEAETPNVSMDQILKPSDVMSDGGSMQKSSSNAANMGTFQKNFILPTECYSVMMFNDEGTAVIFSDEEKPSSQSQLEYEAGAGIAKFLN
jgi:hypothetical protein